MKVEKLIENAEWTFAKNRLREELNGLVPVVFVSHEERAEDMYGTVTHNRARGEHLLDPMEEMVNELIEQGKDTDEICEQLGMSKEEVFRLSGMSRDEFLEEVEGETYSNAKVVLKY